MTEHEIDVTIHLDDTWCDVHRRLEPIDQLADALEGVAPDVARDIYSQYLRDDYDWLTENPDARGERCPLCRALHAVRSARGVGVIG